MIAQLCEILVWVLVHSLWQGILIAACVALCMRWLPAKRAEVRYATSVAGLSAVILCALVTWSILGLEPRRDITRPQGDQIASASPPTEPSPAGFTNLREHVPTESAQPFAVGQSTTTNPNSVTRNWTAWVAALWVIGAAIMLMRTLAAIIEVRHWRSSNVAISQSGLESLQALHAELCECLHLRRAVTLVLSDRVNVPAVIGTLWPCILIPPALLTGIPLDQWRVILAHELAHIRRYDALVNLVQMVIESLLFFNPAVWWLSQQIRIEREACCDALAVETCGQPISVARTLIEFAAGLRGDARWPGARPVEQSDHPPASRSTAVMAFADPLQPGELTDRVQRLVQPEVAARPRMSWVGLTVVLCSLVIAVETLHWGTSLAVQTAANLMTPRERVAKLEKLQTESTGVFLPPEPEVGAQKDPAVKTTAKTADVEKCQVTITVRAADGAPLPKGLQLMSYSRNGNSSSMGTLDHLPREAAEYRKAFPFNPCQLRIGAFADGFAPVVSPVLNVLAEDKERTVELVLNRGRTVTMEVHDSQDHPVAGAALKVLAVLTHAGGTTSLGMQELTTDKQGSVAVPRMGDVPYDLTIRAPGFQRSEIRWQSNSAETQRFVLKPALPVNIEVLAESTGQPVPNARIIVVSVNRANGSHWTGDPRNLNRGDKWSTYAETDSNGKAVLSELVDGIHYTLAVVSDDYALSVLKGVHGGQQLAPVKMTAPLKLAGRIEGDLSRLGKISENGKGKPQYSLGYTLNIDQGHTDYVNALVDADGRFEIGRLMPNEKVIVHLPDRSVDFVLSKSITDAVLKIEPAPTLATVAKRKVIIRLTGTSPNAPARGTLYVNWQHADPAARNSVYTAVPLRENEIHLDVPIGATLYFRPDHLVGYRIEEREDIEISAGETPLVIEVPTRPAGGIHATIVRADGTPATTAFITVFASQLPPGEKDHSHINRSIATASSSVLASLPLGGKYRILARETGDSHNVWVLSDEIAVDETHPITEVRLQLPAGRTVPIKVIGPDGAPVFDQTVTLNLSFSQPKGHSTSFGVNRITGPDGLAKFEEISLDAAVAPLEFKLSAEVVSNEFIGWRNELPLKGPVVIQLQKGLSANGVVIDSESGKPIPMAPVRLLPRDFASAQFKGAKQTVTDSQGEFHFGGLESMAYTAYVEGAVPKGTTINRLKDGRIQFEYRDGVEQNKLDPRTNSPHRLEVTIHPNSALKPLP